MNTRNSYTYVILRYVHDIAAAEFVNVGVVLYAPDSSFVGAKIKKSYGRVKKTFPTLNGEAYRRQLGRLQASFDRIAQRDLVANPQELRVKGILELVHSVLGEDDSSLQWSPVGSGLTASPERALETIYSRFVAKYDEEAGVIQRKDEDIWRCFRSELEKRNVMLHLEEKLIKVEDDSIHFDHAWKNGMWHCYEPLSFDLSSDNSIKEKAHRWLGQVSSVQDASEQFQVFFLVGKPSNEALHEAYAQAVSILRKAPKSSVIEEDQAEEFSQQVAAEIRMHEAGAL